MGSQKSIRSFPLAHHKTRSTRPNMTSSRYRSFEMLQREDFCNMTGLGHLRVIDFKAEQEWVRALAQLSARFAACTKAVLPCNTSCTGQLLTRLAVSGCACSGRRASSVCRYVGRLANAQTMQHRILTGLTTSSECWHQQPHS